MHEHFQVSEMQRNVLFVYIPGLWQREQAFWCVITMTSWLSWRFYHQRKENAKTWRSSWQRPTNRGIAVIVNIATDHIVFSGLIEKITDYQPLHPSDVPKGKNVQIHNGAFYHSSNPSYPNVRTYTHFFLIKTNILYMRLWIEGSAFAF